MCLEQRQNYEEWISSGYSNETGSTAHPILAKGPAANQVLIVQILHLVQLFATFARNCEHRLLGN